MPTYGSLYRLGSAVPGPPLALGGACAGRSAIFMEAASNVGPSAKLESPVTKTASMQKAEMRIRQSSVGVLSTLSTTITYSGTSAVLSNRKPSCFWRAVKMLGRPPVGSLGVGGDALPVSELARRGNA